MAGGPGEGTGPEPGSGDGPVWPEARVEVPPGADEAAVERLEAWLEGAGALSITAVDAEAAGEPAGGPDTDATLAHAVLEPAPGETRLWRRTALVALFERGADPGTVRADLARAAAVSGLDPVPAIALSGLDDAVWERAWMDDFRPMRFGPRFVVAPHHLVATGGATGSAATEAASDVAPGAAADPARIGPDDVVLALDPGLAFGTGTHPTTALCLEWLGAGTARSRAPLAGRTVIDYGCGSGVLAIAAVLLGATRAVAVDIDPQALEATAANARANGVDDRIETGLPAVLDGAEPADVLLANILQGPLAALAGTLAGLVVPGGALALSGVLASQGEALRLSYTSAFDFGPDASRDGWALLSATRRGGTRAPRGEPRGGGR